MNVIIDYKVGNIFSVQRGFDRANIETIISNDIDVIKNAELLILPGVGAFKDAYNDLEQTGLIPAIINHVKEGKILLGICLGMQLLFDSSTEYGQSPGLGLIKGEIDLLEVELKVPHMGWNSLNLDMPKDPILNYIKEDDYVYFIHSYYAKTKDDYIVASTDYGVKVPAIVRNKNVIGMQFHPEKSGEVGLRLLQAIKELI